MNTRQGIVASIFFLSYILLGGLVFMVIENDFEVHTVDASVEYLQALDRIRDEYLQVNPLNLSESELREFHDHVQAVRAVLVENHHHTNSTIASAVTTLTYDECIFFCLIMITTIGYGNVTPKTSGGQLFCICYALVGIPMTGILLAALGNKFSSRLLKVHEKSKSRHYNSRMALVVNTIIYLIPGFVLCIFLPAGIFTLLEDWSFVNGLYYCFITLFTVGFGDLVAGNEASEEYQWIYRVSLMVWIIFGMSYLSMILNFIAKAMKSKKLRSLEKSVANSLRQTQERVNREMEYFLKAMNTFYAKRIKTRGDTPELQRSSSCPSLSGMTEAELAAELTKQPYAKHAEGSVNFIFDLAMALACGPAAYEDGNAADNDNNNNFNQLPNVGRRGSLPSNVERRRSSIAQLLSLALAPPINGDNLPSKSDMGLQDVLAHFDALRVPSFVLPFGDVIEADNETCSEDLDCDTQSVSDEGPRVKVPNGHVVKDSEPLNLTCPQTADSVIQMPEDCTGESDEETQVSKL